MNLLRLKALLGLCLICLIGFNFSCIRNETDRGFNVVQELTNANLNFDNDSAQQALLDSYLAEKKNQFEFKLSQSEVGPIDFETIAPLFRQYCTSCHRSGGNAPFQLSTFPDIKKRAKAIREALVSAIMPPWRADNSYNQYHNSQAIPDSLREKMIHWVDQGTKKSIEIPEEQLVDKNSEQADVFLRPTDPFTLHSNKDDYVCNIIDPQFDKETFIKAFIFQSDNINLIHHYTLFVDTTGNFLGNTGNWSCKRDSIFTHLALVDTWTKGIIPIKYAEGLAYRFPKSSKFLLQTHYSGYGNKGKSESCTMSIYTTKEKPKHIVKWAVTNNNDIFIPANTIQKESSTWDIEEDIILLGVVPHMHYLGQKMEIFALTPEGKKERILFIEDWSYVVQNKYMLAKPITLPKGSKVYTNVVYDNTDENPEQPNHPVRDVTFELSSYDEMLAVGHYYISSSTIIGVPDKTVEFIK